MLLNKCVHSAAQQLTLLRIAGSFRPCRAGRDGQPAQSVVYYSTEVGRWHSMTWPGMPCSCIPCQAIRLSLLCLVTGPTMLPPCLPMFRPSQDRQRIEYVLAKGDEERQEKRQARQGTHTSGSGGGGGAQQKQLQAFGQVVDYCLSASCRRAKVLAEFGEAPPPPPAGGATTCCDACARPTEVAAAIKALRTAGAQRLQRFAGGKHALDFAGSGRSGGSRGAGPGRLEFETSWADEGLDYDQGGWAGWGWDLGWGSGTQVASLLMHRMNLHVSTRPMPKLLPPPCAEGPSWALQDSEEEDAIQGDSSEGGPGLMLGIRHWSGISWTGGPFCMAFSARVQRCSSRPTALHHSPPSFASSADEEAVAAAAAARQHAQDGKEEQLFAQMARAERRFEQEHEGGGKRARLLQKLEAGGSGGKGAAGSGLGGSSSGGLTDALRQTATRQLAVALSGNAAVAADIGGSGRAAAVAAALEQQLAAGASKSVYQSKLASLVLQIKKVQAAADVPALAAHVSAAAAAEPAAPSAAVETVAVEPAALPIEHLQAQVNEAVRLAGAAGPPGSSNSSSAAAAALRDLAALPVTVRLLEQTGAGKAVQKLRKHQLAPIAAAAAACVSAWKARVLAGPAQ